MTISNDVFVPGSLNAFNRKTDHNFSHGTKIKTEIDSEKAPTSLKSLGKYIPDADLPEIQVEYGPNGLPQRWSIGSEKPKKTYNITLGQDIYTPEDLSSTELIETDNPYAGWLYLQVDEEFSNKNRKYSNSVALGITGKHSLSETTQKFVHELCSCDDPKGWHNQLRGELGIVLTHTRDIRYYKLREKLLDVDVISGTQLRLGNIHTDLSIHSEIRMGKHLPDLDENLNKWSLYWFGKGSGRAVGRNIFYDGNTFKRSHSVDKEHWVFELDTGFAIKYKSWLIGLHHKSISKEYRNQSGGLHSIGIIELKKHWK